MPPVRAHSCSRDDCIPHFPSLDRDREARQSLGTSGTEARASQGIGLADNSRLVFSEAKNPNLNGGAFLNTVGRIASGSRVSEDNLGSARSESENGNFSKRIRFFGVISARS